jgi:hypothetical protein
MYYKVKSNVNTPFYRAMSYIEPALFPLVRIDYGDPNELNRMLRLIVRSGMTVQEVGDNIEENIDESEFVEVKGTAIQGDNANVHHYGLVFFGSLIAFIFIIIISTWEGI